MRVECREHSLGQPAFGGADSQMAERVFPGARPV
jgi:hypothetical protein